MKLLVGRLAGLVVLAAVVALGLVNFKGSGPGVDNSGNESMTSYGATYAVSKTGVLTAEERLTFDFGDPRHGIFRIFDLRDLNDPKVLLTPADVTVRRDGQPEPYSVQTSAHGRYRTLKIGSAGSTLTGVHTYEIGYTIKSVLRAGNGVSTPSQFYWNLVGAGWAVPIARSDITVQLPGKTQLIGCLQGTGTGASSCALAQGNGTDTLHVITGALAPNTPVTLKTGVDVPTPAVDRLPWNASLVPMLGSHPALLALVLAMSLLLGAGGWMLSRSTKEDNPQFPLLYAPPDGIGPAQASYLLTETVDNKAFVATMMYAAERGLVGLDLQGKTWTITGKADDARWSELDEVTAYTGTSLGVTSTGAAFSADPSSVAAGQQLKSALASFEANAAGWARTQGLMVGSGLGGAGLIVLGALGLLAVFLGAYNPLNMSVLALLPGLAAIGGLALGMTGAGTKRTPAGRDLWSRVGGFRRILSTPSAQDRFDFAGRKDLYTSYLPWAVAFDCADEWAKKYQVETGEEPPAPSWFPMYAGISAMNYMNQMVDSFDSAVSSAISSYQATQAPSGGGGGFGGGGGSGGGGGGTW